MPTVLRESTPVARKPHWCSLCNTRIEPGQRYRVEVYVDPYGDGIYTWHECAACHDDMVAQMVWEWAGKPHEGIGPDEADEWAREMVAQGGDVERAVTYLARRGITP